MPSPHRHFQVIFAGRTTFPVFSTYSLGQSTLNVVLADETVVSDENTVLFGGFQYWMRQGGAATDRPTQWDVQTSPDGNVWTTAWTSLPNLAVDPSTAMFQQLVTKPFLAKYVKVRILTNQGGKTYTNLGEFKALGATTVTVDSEKEAEINYL